MTNEQAIKVLDEIKTNDDSLTQYIRGFDEALDMAIEALEEISHLINRPCEACEFHGENGCCKWECVFKGV